MTRAAAWLAPVVVLLPSRASAQTSLFLEGLAELARTMLASSADADRANAAIDRMAAGLHEWEARADSSSTAHVLLGDETVSVPALPLAAYADGFARILRGDYRNALASLRHATGVAPDERAELVVAGRLAQQGRHLEAERTLRAVGVGRFVEIGAGTGDAFSAERVSRPARGGVAVAARRDRRRAGSESDGHHSGRPRRRQPCSVRSLILS